MTQTIQETIVRTRIGATRDTPTNDSISIPTEPFMDSDGGKGTIAGPIIVALDIMNSTAPISN